jgi:hypothetical protein
MIKFDPALTWFHKAAGHARPGRLVIARNVVPWQSMAHGEALYLDVDHGLLRFARNDG